MKRIVCLFVLVAAGIAPAAGPAKNLIPNGSFEQGLTGWEAKGVTVREMPGVAPKGKHALELDPKASGQVSCKVKLTVGAEYRISFRVNAPAFKNSFLCVYLNPTGPGEQPYRIVAAHTGGHSYGRPSSAASAPVGRWTRRSATFVAEQELNTFRVGPGTRWSVGTPGTLWVDDVNLVATGRKMEYGRDWEYRAILPSEAAIGQSVRMLISANWVAPGGSFRYGTPTRLVHSVQVKCDDIKASCPKEVTLGGPGDAWALKRVNVTFRSPGVHRVAIRDAAGNKALSNPVRVTAKLPRLRHYWGDVHIHTRYQHGGEKAGDENDNYRFCRDVAALDFAALSEHYGSSVTPNVLLNKMAEATQRFNAPGRFVTLLGIETGSWQGHHNFYVRGDDPLGLHDRRDRLGGTENILDYYHWAGTRILCIPHHIALLQPTDWRIADRDYCRLVEVYSNHGSGEEPGKWWRLPGYHGSGNRYRESGAVRGHTWRDALARGRRLGAMGSGDAHSGRPGLTGVTCTLAGRLGRKPIFDAMYARRCYATTNARILLDFEINGALMGEEIFLAEGKRLHLSAAANACGPIDRIEVIRNGKVYKTIGGASQTDVSAKLDLGEFDGRVSYYYLRLMQADGHRAWTSPIWVSPAGKSDLVLERKDFTYDRAQRTLTVRPRNYGDAKDMAKVRVYSSAKDPLLGRAQFAGRKRGVSVRVEPINDNACMLQIVIWSNDRRDQGSGEFKCTGKLTLKGAKSYEVALDPRGVLTPSGDGELSWSDTYGMFFKYSQSRSGVVSDMAVRVETGAETVAELTVEIDGKPVRLLAVGSQPGPAGKTVKITLSGLAAKTLIARQHVVIPPRGGSATVVVKNAPPGVTYVAVVDPDGEVSEADERNNIHAFAVEAEARRYNPWPEFKTPTRGKN